MKTTSLTTISFVLICAVFASPAHSQVTTFQNDIIESDDQSASLKSYSTSTPSLATGAVNVNIPIYTVGYRGVNVPISLQYVSNGIKVEDDPFPCGYGWRLTPSYKITRTVMGRPDEMFPMKLQRDSTETEEDYLRRCGCSIYAGADTLTTEPLYDTSPDVFYLSMPDGGCSFFSRRKAGGGLDFILADDCGYKITTTEYLTAIEVTDMKGVKYMFGDLPGDTTDMVEMSNYGFYPTLWPLRKITLLNGEEINLSWDYSEHSYTSPERISGLVVDQTGNEPVVTTTENLDGYRNYDYDDRYVLVLSKVEFPLGTVTINRPLGDPNLSDIVVRNANGNPVKLCKFAYNAHNDLLTGISLSGEGVYRFDYNSQRFDSIGAQDRWGYYNGITSNRYTRRPSISLKVCGQADSVYYKEIPGADRSTVAEYMKANILTKVTYPTGGYTTFEYEPHHFIPAAGDTTNVRFRFDTSQGIGGGLRVCRTVTSTGSAAAGMSPNIVKEYVYGKNGDGLANMRSQPDANSFVDYHRLSLKKSSVGSGVVDARAVFVNAYPKHMRYNSGEMPVWYDEVAEISSVGKTIHKFKSMFEPDSVIPGNVEAGLIHPNALNHVLSSGIVNSEVEYYKTSGAGYALEKRIKTTHVVDNSLSNNAYGISGDSIPARWTGRRVFDSLLTLENSHLIYGVVQLTAADSLSFAPFYESAAYSFRPLKERLTSIREVNYVGNDSVWANIDITYHPHTPLVRSRALTASDSTHLTKDYYYPVNREWQTSSSTQRDIMNLMVQRNVISVPFRTERQDGSSSQRIDTYFNGAPMFLPYREYFYAANDTVVKADYVYDIHGNATGRRLFCDIGESIEYDGALPCMPTDYHVGVMPNEISDNTKPRLSSQIYTEPLSAGMDITDPAGGGWIRQYDVGGRLFSECIKGGAQKRYTYHLADSTTALPYVRIRNYLSGDATLDDTDLDDLWCDYNLPPSTGSGGGDSGGGEVRDPLLPYPDLTLNHPLSVGQNNVSFDTFQYYDGLGREKQELVPGSAVFGFSEYGAMGRLDKQWQPVATASASPLSAADILSAAQSFYSDNAAYTLTEYEPSGIGGVASVTRPGQAQHLADKKITSETVINSASDPQRRVAWLSVGGTGQLTCHGYYPSCSVSGTKMTDEDGRIVVRFVDSQGKTLLDRTVVNAASGLFADTYYVYDGFGRLRLVVPPMASDALVSASSHTYPVDDANMKKYCYCYRYDAIGNLVEKRLPGQEPVLYLYDKGQKLTLSQTGNQRGAARTFGASSIPAGDWTYYLYDRMGRKVVEGTMSLSDGEPELFTDTIVTAQYAADPYFVGGYSLSSGILPVEPEVSVAYYYDNYDFLGRQSYRKLLGESPRANSTDFNYVTTEAGDACHNSAMGRLTGSLVYKQGGLGGQTSRLSTFYYNLAGDLVQSHAENHLGGMTHLYVKRTPTQMPSETTKIVTTAAVDSLSETITERYRYIYDNFGRIAEVYHKLDDDDELRLIANQYDAIGRIVGTDVGGDASAAAAENAITYDVQGRTKTITSDQFSQTLTYGYDGNITANQWESGDNVTRNYAYTYDKLNRLTAAVYSDNAQSGADYSTTYGYDSNSNPTSVTRKGRVESLSADIDYLSLHYNGNQLSYVDDYADDGNTYGAVDFHDGHEGGTDYVWDRNGNMTKDLNKNISSITYNSLNLPSSITYSDGHRVYYTYDAMGNRQRVTYQTAILPAAGILPRAELTIPDESSPSRGGGGEAVGGVENGTRGVTRYRTVLTRDYVDNLVFENGELKYVITPTGFIEDGEYYHQLADYEGNPRVVVDNEGTVYERNNYYPFGLPIVDEHYASAITPYKYGNKEFDTMNGQNLYDFEARFYDPALCQFPEADPLAEDYCPLSPYLYCAANPTALIDPTGLGWIKIDVPNDTYYIYDPDVNSPSEATQKYLYGHVTYIGNKSYDITFGYGGTSNRDISIRLFSSGNGFSINGVPYSGEFNGDGLKIGNLIFVSTSLWNYGNYVGPNNPQYNDGVETHDSYILPPKSMLDHVARWHDEAYDNVDAKGIDGVLSKKTVIADEALIRRAIYISGNSHSLLDRFTGSAVAFFFWYILLYKR